MSMRDIRDGSRGIGVWAVLAVVAIVAAIAVLLIGTFGFGWFSNTTADFRGGVDARDRTVGSGQYRIAQYDDFHNRCQGLVAAQAQIDADADPETAAGLPPQIAATNRAADARSYREQAADYNARAAATATTGQFRDSGLPAQVPATYTANTGEKVNCG